jgi:hypothetical protein
MKPMCAPRKNHGTAINNKYSFVINSIPDLI